MENIRLRIAKYSYTTNPQQLTEFEGELVVGSCVVGVAVVGVAVTGEPVGENDGLSEEGLTVGLVEGLAVVGLSVVGDPDGYA